MPEQNRIVSPGPHQHAVKADNGQILTVPRDWDWLPAGDAGLTRRVKSTGPSWTVKQKKGRRVISLGVWASRARIAEVRAAVEAERATPAYARRRAADARRRNVKQQQYVEDFRGAVLAFLDFAPAHAALAEKLATAVAEHATPVGSGTVARTQRIPIEQRAESAVIAWMRHQTTGYDNMKIARVKGRRREIRRLLAERSRSLLQGYRRGEPVAAATCPLQRALREM